MNHRGFCVCFYAFLLMFMGIIVGYPLLRMKTCTDGFFFLQ